MLPVFAHNIDNLSMNELVRNDEEGTAHKRKLYEQGEVQAILRKMIPYFDRMHIFDWLIPKYSRIRYRRFDKK